MLAGRLASMLAGEQTTGEEAPMRELLFFLLVLACPLAMFFMMRGGHGHTSAHSSDEQPRRAERRRT